MKLWVKYLGACMVWLVGLGELPAVSQQTVIRSKSGKYNYEIFLPKTAAKTIILLHGSSGPEMPLYREQAAFFAAHGYRVLMPHYYDATRTHTPNEENYKAWVNLVEDLLAETKDGGSVYLVGYSLGASIALAAGSQMAPVAGIADFYGSLPDEFFFRMQGMPPLLILHGQRDTNIPVMNAQQLIQLCGMKRLTCENHLYPDQGHGFEGAALSDADERTLTFFARFPATTP